VVLQEGTHAEGLLAIRPAVEFHLEHAEIKPHLKFVSAVETGDDSDLKVVGVVIPAGQDGANVFTHVRSLSAVPPMIRPRWF
jgi:hypothetical protein